MMSLYYKIHQRNICKTCSNEISKHEYHHDPRNMNKTHKIRVQLNKSNAQNNNENFIKVIKTLVLSHRKYEWMFQSHEHTVLCNGSIVNKIEKRIELDRIVRGRKGDETIETSFSFFVMFVWLLCLCVAFGLSYILISLYVCFIMIGVRIFDEWSACFHASIMIHSTTRNHVFMLQVEQFLEWLVNHKDFIIFVDFNLHICTPWMSNAGMTIRVHYFKVRFNSLWES